MHCPICQHELTPDQIRSLNAGLSSSLRTKHRGGRPPALSPAKRKRALRMLAHGHTQAETAIAMGVSQWTISRLAGGAKV
jgi:DNA-binding CsgD family transcriptional regulator